MFDRRLTIVYLLLTLHYVVLDVSALRCQSCAHESCAESRGYISEDCDPSVEFCYTLTSENGKVYRTGCALTDCSRILVVSRGSCALCDRDNCNAVHSTRPLDLLKSSESESKSSEEREAVNHESPKIEVQVHDHHDVSTADSIFNSVPALLVALLISLGLQHYGYC